jgi:formylglycine-generating enzyme required for sulfatase activity
MNAKSLGVSLGLCALALGSFVTAHAAAPVITNITLIRANPHLGIQSDVGAINRVQFTTNLSQANWVVLTNLVVSQGGYEFVHTNPSVAPARFYRIVACPTNAPSGMSMIPAGPFTMGDTLDADTNAVPAHSVYVSAFYMDRNLVSKSLWDQVSQWATNHGYVFQTTLWGTPYGLGKAASHPVQEVTWYIAVKWCNARAEKEGLTPCYYTDAAQTEVYRDQSVSISNIWVQWTANGYRLPTEAEWEKAARGGVSGHRFPWSGADTITQARANYNSTWSGGHPIYSYDLNSISGYSSRFNDGVTPYTSPVGFFPANGYGLYDMSGNVWEWCWDWYRIYWYGEAGATQNDTRGPVSGDLIGGPPLFTPRRVIRGGSWVDDAHSARCANRSNGMTGAAGDLLGFRCARGL